MSTNQTRTFIVVMSGVLSQQAVEGTAWSVSEDNQWLTIWDGTTPVALFNAGAVLFVLTEDGRTA